MKFNGNIFGYYLNKDNITFYIEDEKCTEIIGNYDVYISGSFNGWMTSADAAWKLDKKNIKGKRCHLFEKNLNSVIVPGNSGFPEFNFFILTENGVRYLKPDFEWDNRFGFKPGAYPLRARGTGDDDYACGAYRCFDDDDIRDKYPF